MEDVKQGRCPWAGSDAPREPAVVLPPETTAQLIALLARALLAVVRAAAEAGDDR